MLKRLIGLCAAFVLFAAPATASARDEASHRLELAERFVSLMQAEDMGRALGESVSDLIPIPADMPAEDRRIFEETMSEMVQDYLPALFKAMAPVYADIFTVEELTALVAFYESDVGRSMVRKSYEAAPRINIVAQAVLPDVLERTMNRMCDRLECTAEDRQELKAVVQGLRGQAPQTK